MLVRVTQDCFTSDCRYLHKETVIDYTGAAEDKPRYYEPLTPTEERRFYARATDAQIAFADGAGGMEPEEPKAPRAPRDVPQVLADADKEGQILAALQKLDPDNDAHWTTGGDPLMAVVEELFGSDDITRAEIRAVAPAFRRDNLST